MDRMIRSASPWSFCFAAKIPPTRVNVPGPRNEKSELLCSVYVFWDCCFNETEQLSTNENKAHEAEILH